MKLRTQTSASNFTLILAAFLVVALGIMGYMAYRQNVLLASLDKPTETFKSQSSEDDINSIEKDSEDTNFDDIDKELIDIETELNSSE